MGSEDDAGGRRRSGLIGRGGMRQGGGSALYGGRRSRPGVEVVWLWARTLWGSDGRVASRERRGHTAL